MAKRPRIRTGFLTAAGLSAAILGTVLPGHAQDNHPSPTAPAGNAAAFNQSGNPPAAEAEDRTPSPEDYRVPFKDERKSGFSYEQVRKGAAIRSRIANSIVYVYYANGTVSEDEEPGHRDHDISDGRAYRLIRDAARQVMFQREHRDLLVAQKTAELVEGGMSRKKAEAQAAEAIIEYDRDFDGIILSTAPTQREVYEYEIEHEKPDYLPSDNIYDRLEIFIGGACVYSDNVMDPGDLTASTVSATERGLALAQQSERERQKEKELAAKPGLTFAQGD